MKALLSLRRHPRIKGVVSYLLVLVLVVVMVGCGRTPGRFTPIPDPGSSLDLEIRTWHDLDAIRDNLAGHHRLMNDLDATTDGYEALASPTADGGKGWEPVGDWDPYDHNLYLAFSGTFDGQGYEIRDLFIDRPGDNTMGLFRYVSEGAVVKDVGLIDATVTGGHYVGGLVAHLSGTVDNCYSSGTVTGEWAVGGLVGANHGGTVSNCYSTSSVTGDREEVGGLVGRHWGGAIDNSYATGSVTGYGYVGGLVGVSQALVAVTNCYSAGSVAGEWAVGGLVGANHGGAVSNCYSTGSVTGDRDEVGGLVGRHWGGTIDNSYAIGSVTGYGYVGGLVGVSRAWAAVNNCYSAGRVDGELAVGGLVGENRGVVPSSSSFWDVETSGQAISDGGTGKTTAEMQSIATFTDTETEGLDKPWNMTTVSAGETDPAYTWNIVDGQTYPFLSRKQPGQLLEIRTWHDLHAVRDNLSGHYVLMNDLDATTAGYEELAGPTADQGKGWEPIGTHDQPFMGRLDGQGHRISDLFVDRLEDDYVGLFAAVGEAGVIASIGLVNVAVSGALGVGGLVGESEGAVMDAYSTGSITGAMAVGGLVGGIIRQGTVTNSYSVASVTGGLGVGGLAGANADEGTVSNCYSTGSVSGDFAAGGLVGGNDGTVSNCYSTGSVSGDWGTGGLVGHNSGTVRNCYSSGNVTGVYEVGGLVGYNQEGVLGEDDGIVSGSFWDVETSGMDVSAGGTGKTTAEMQDIATYTDTDTEGLDEPWDIGAVAPGKTDPVYNWNIVDGQTYPFLGWQSSWSGS